MAANFAKLPEMLRGPPPKAPGWSSTISAAPPEARRMAVNFTKLPELLR